MSSGWIVEPLDVLGDRDTGDRAVLVDLFLDVLFLQAAEEGLSDGNVPAVASAAHAGYQPIGLVEASPVVASVLGPLIRVDDGLLGSSPSNSHQDSVKEKPPANSRGNSP